ncbi:membrane protein implicated in regulation of membrane protease activity [Methylocaldum marinum]|uniref:Membrane protein implicated in regulation of membrane protease activity n=1 Tax=Methylocaldum marinum TaxID=1432792 RepID=A0A250KVE8_9GAMM|nr:NfeD family protein [Methylocaldum marinum]BBA35587.1 membrane protein implicated in regulation of membrane protease activity [Methylocaldum marinum]
MEFEIIFWHWWAFGVFLLIVELLAPGIFFLWMAESAFVVGVIKLIVPTLSWESQLILFSVMSVVSIVVFRLFLRKHPLETDQPLLNRRAAQYVGRLFTLEYPIVNGQGWIRVDDSTWKVQGEDCEPGSKVRVVAAEGVLLKVEKSA